MAHQANIAERKLRSAAEIAKKGPTAVDRIARGETTIIQERATLDATARAAVTERQVAAPTGCYPALSSTRPGRCRRSSVRCGRIGWVLKLGRQCWPARVWELGGTYRMA